MLRRNHPESPILGWPVAPEVLTDAINQVYTELRENLQGSDLGGGWHTAVTVRTHFGDNFLGRARVARNWIGTLGVEEAMYIMAEIDAKGEMLEGSRRYLLRFSPGHLPSVDAFWSITLYRRSDCLLVNNSLGRYSIGDRTRGLQLDADGGLSIRIQATDPGTGNNWLPAPANEAFYLTLRLYQPRADHLDNRFVYPALERVE
jgi:hypothetical protein